MCTDTPLCLRTQSSAWLPMPQECRFFHKWSVCGLKKCYFKTQVPFEEKQWKFRQFHAIVRYLKFVSLLSGGGGGLRCCYTNDDYDDGDNYLLFKHIHNSQMPIRICNSSGRWSERKWLKSRPGESLIHNQISRLIVSPAPVLISIGVAHPGEK